MSDNTPTIILSVTIIVIVILLFQYKKTSATPEPTPVSTTVVTPVKTATSYLYKSGPDYKRKRFLQRYNPYDFLRSSRDFRRERFAPEFDLSTQTLSRHPLSVNYQPITFVDNPPYRHH